jgi:cyclopropane fatty-acyl-phospholipid synthase-like methyltransferase
VVNPPLPHTQLEVYRILDLGCGSGQFGELCVKTGYNYVGLDYSSAAIAIAKGRKQGKAKYFHVDLKRNQSFISEGGYNLVTSIEFFEHIKRDLEIMQKIPTKKRIILTGPSYDSEEHVRFFRTLDEITERYEPFMTIHNRMTLSGKNIAGEDSHIYVLEGVRR